MALWHFIDKDGAGVAWDEGGKLVSEFDDGFCYKPDEEGFSREDADVRAKELGATAELTGVPGWHLRVEHEAASAADAAKLEQDRKDKEAAQAAEAEQKRKAHAEAEASINNLLNPPKVDTPEEVAKKEVNTRFDALLTAAPDRKTDIEKLRKAALEALK